MSLPTPSHDPFNRPGDEGSDMGAGAQCSPAPKSWPDVQGSAQKGVDGDNSKPPVPMGDISIAGDSDHRNFSGGKGRANPTEAMPGA